MAEFNDKKWVWQQKSWSDFTWDKHALEPMLREVTRLQGKLLGKAGAITHQNSTEYLPAP